MGPKKLSHHCFRCCVFAATMLCLPTSYGDQPTPAGMITVVPSVVKLTDMRQPQSLLVLGRTADGFALDLTDQAVSRSTDESVAVVDRGLVRPLKSGEAKITVQAAGQTIDVPVVVTLPAQERPYSFRSNSRS